MISIDFNWKKHVFLIADDFRFLEMSGLKSDPHEKSNKVCNFNLFKEGEFLNEKENHIAFFSHCHVDRLVLQC